MRLINGVVAVLLLLIPLTATAWGQSGQSGYPHPKFMMAAFEVDVPLSGSERIGSAAWGGFLEHRSPEGIGWMLDVDIARSYYDYDDGWYGPVGWNAVDSGDTSSGDWIFYQRDVLISALANYYPPLASDRVAVAFGGGASLSFAVRSDSIESYPELKEYTDEQWTGIQPGFVLRGTAEYSFTSFLFGGGGLRFQFRNLKGLPSGIERDGGFSYLADQANLFFYIAAGF